MFSVDFVRIVLINFISVHFSHSLHFLPFGRRPFSWTLKDKWTLWCNITSIFLFSLFLKNRNEGKNETLKQQLCTDPKGTMATPGDCPRSELQVILVLLFENLYLKTGTITESGAHSVTKWWWFPWTLEGGQ